MTTQDEQRARFGQWLIGARRRARMTQVEAAKAADTSQTHWWRLEKGESGTTREMIGRIAIAFSLAPHEATAAYELAGFSAPTMEDVIESADAAQKAAAERLIDDMERKIGELRDEYGLRKTG